MITKFKDLHIRINKSKRTAYIVNHYPIWGETYTMTREEINKCWQWSNNDWKEWIKAKDNNLI